MKGVSNRWTRIWNGTMEWKMLDVTVAANLCNYAQSKINNLVYIPLSDHRSFKSMNSIVHLPQYPGMVLSLAHHPVLCYCTCRIAKLDSHTRARPWLCGTIYWMSLWTKKVMAEIGAWSSVSLLQSSSVHLNPQSLLSLNSSSSLNSSKHGPHVRYCT